MRDDTFYYSQFALSIYQSCQLRFRRRYLDGLYWPRPADEQIRMGSDFHLISQRYFAYGHKERYDGELGRWLDAFYRFRPFDESLVFLPEQELRLSDGALRMVAKFDLIMLAPDRVVIYDWKTDERRLVREYYERTYQTLFYRYMLVKAGSGYWNRPIAPSDVVMIYWNPRYPSTVVSLPYDERQYRKDGERLGEMIEEIENRDIDRFFATTEERVCRACEYSPICHGTPPVDLEDETDDLSLSWDDIEELPC
jgi:radical SAM protein with 4Fe4S-binding SPASM domain